ncbi:MAG: hypothetical protein SVE93_05710, partial [Candidatus Thermoplasmatota archaeon]|nr:hypothetical protein [Candidatus Thermoplasmatota archaeon]
ITLTPAYAESANVVRIVFTVMLFITAFVFCFVSLKKITGVPDIKKSIGDQKKLLPFLEGVSQLIGESTMTIYKYGMEDYKKSYPAEKETEKEKEKDMYNFLVMYFENYIGPISSRIARDVDNRVEEKKIGSVEDKRNN